MLLPCAAWPQPPCVAEHKTALQPVTDTVAEASSEAWFVALAEAVFTNEPHPPLTVGLVRWIVRTAPLARSPKLQVNVSLTIEQPITAGLSDQLSPVPVGSGSDTVTPVAVPGPLLVSVIVKPIGLPAVTDGTSASFVRL